jgi:hypothetical protein
MNLLLITPAADKYTRISRYVGTELVGCVEIVFEQEESTDSLFTFLEFYRSTGETEPLCLNS